MQMQCAARARARVETSRVELNYATASSSHLPVRSTGGKIRRRSRDSHKSARTEERDRNAVMQRRAPLPPEEPLDEPQGPKGSGLEYLSQVKKGTEPRRRPLVAFPRVVPD